MARQLFRSACKQISVAGGRPPEARECEIIPGMNSLKLSARSERGTSLIETMIAAVILITAVVGLLPVFTAGIQITYQQGDIGTRLTEYAQDKIEQLLNLNNATISIDGFTDGQTDTTVFPAVTNGSTGCTGTGTTICGLGGAMAASTSVGSIPPAAPVTYFSQYLDVNGNLLTSSAGATYTIQWQVSADSTGNLKTITVVAFTDQVAGIKGLTPSVTLVATKAYGI